ncbi:MAG: SHOCT domain-containing protein, partial [Bacillus sp. (in: firmicutes)]
IQVKLGGFITNGYIQFSIPGGNESTKGLWSATQDENSVTFEKSDNPVVEQIKAKIEELQRAMKNSGGMVIQNTVSTADEIKKFKELMDQGIITIDEYEAKKKQLLNI